MAGSWEKRTQARRLCEEIGDRFCTARALRIEGNYLMFRNPVAAKVDYDQALAIARDVGSLAEQTTVLDGLAYFHFVRGDLATSERSYRQALLLCPEVGDPACYASFQLGLSDVLRDEGHLADARKAATDVLRSALSRADKESVERALLTLGDTARLSGDFAGAIARYREGLQMQDQIRNPILNNDFMTNWGDTLLLQGDLVGARSKYEAATLETPQKKLSLARLALWTGDAAGCESLSRLAVKGFHDLTDSDDEAVATALLALALDRDGKRADAARTMTSAQVKIKGSQRPLSTFMVSAAAAHLNPRVVQITPVVRAASRFGYPKHVIELAQQP